MESLTEALAAVGKPKRQAAQLLKIKNAVTISSPVVCRFFIGVSYNTPSPYVKRWLPMIDKAGKQWLYADNGNFKNMVDQKIKKRAVHRAKIIQGQLEGLIRAIDREDYCTKLLNHSLSIQRSLQSLNTLLLENHLRSHVSHQMHDQKGQLKAIKELVEIYIASHKR